MDWLTLQDYEIEAILLSLKVSGWAVAGSLPFGIACAWLLARRHFPGKILIDGIIHMPLVLPPVVVGYVLLIAFGRNGFIGLPLREWLGLSIAFTWKGAAVAAAVVSFPLMVRAIRLSLEQVDRGLEHASRSLGASPLDTFFTVTLPLILPGILTGVILSFARCLSEFGATITFVSNIPGETRTLPIALYTFTQVPGGEAAAFRLCVISVILALLALMGSEIMARRVHKRLAG